MRRAWSSTTHRRCRIRGYRITQRDLGMCHWHCQPIQQGKPYLSALASERRIGQAYVAAWDHDDEPKNTLYERATLLISSRAIFKCAA
jgi:hypothetical protein